MKKLSIALTLLLCVSAFDDAAYVAPVSPVRFRQNQDYQILSYILLDSPLGPKAEVYVNGECADMEQTLNLMEFLDEYPERKDEIADLYKADALIGYLANEFYRNAPDGLKGNDDCGQMSAWYMFASLGFYPIDPVSCRFVIGAPQIDRATMRWDNGKTFTVKVERPTDDCIFVKETYLNGTLLDRPYITYDEIMGGGTLRFVMYDRPDRDELLSAR